METGRVINRRYLLQRLTKQGRDCTVYQGVDQLLQRNVAVTVPLAEHIPAYRAAIRATAQFSHPHIVGIYDLIIEPKSIYIVQEYVDGDTFEALLNVQLTPYEVAEFGLHICRALLYAGTPARKVCHGDLTPDSVMRDRYGYARVNNFAVSSDMYYFSNWGQVGGDGVVTSDRELPAGQMTDGRRADDVRAVGLLLYQLLSGRAPGATSVEPPTDGRLRFMRGVPAELCEVVARTVIRQHPEHIDRPEKLYAELKALTEVLEPPPPALVTAGAVRQTEDIQQASPVNAGRLVTSLPVRESVSADSGYSSFQGSVPLQMSPREVAPASPTIADMSFTQRPNSWSEQAAYPSPAVEPRRLNLVVLLGLGLALFAVFFVVGFFLAQALIH